MTLYSMPPGVYLNIASPLVGLLLIILIGYIVKKDRRHKVRGIISLIVAFTYLVLFLLTIILFNYTHLSPLYQQDFILSPENSIIIKDVELTSGQEYALGIATRFSKVELRGTPELFDQLLNCRIESTGKDSPDIISEGYKSPSGWEVTISPYKQLSGDDFLFFSCNSDAMCDLKIVFGGKVEIPFQGPQLVIGYKDKTALMIIMIGLTILNFVFAGIFAILGIAFFIMGLRKKRLGEFGGHNT